jgi:predicted membrane protein
VRHRRDGSTLIGGLALVFGLAWLAARVNIASVSAEAVIAIALMIVGATMVITARTDWALSRRAWPALAGGVLVVAAMAASPSFGNVSNLRIGDHTEQYTAWADVPAVVQGGVGHTIVDLSQLPAPPPQDMTLRVEAKIGKVDVLLPPNVHTIVNAGLAAGSIDVNGIPTKGFRPRVGGQEISPTAPGPVLHLTIRAGPGAVDVGVVDPNAAPSKETVVPAPTVPPEPTVPPQSTVPPDATPTSVGGSK